MDDEIVDAAQIEVVQDPPAMPPDWDYEPKTDDERLLLSIFVYVVGRNDLPLDKVAPAMLQIARTIRMPVGGI